MQPQTILLIGGTGVVGTHVAAGLAGRPGVRALARTPAAAAALQAAGVTEVVHGDLADPPTLTQAFAGVERLFLVTPFTPDQAALEIAALREAERAGVRHVVKVSVGGADQPDPIAFAASHLEVERHLASTDMGTTLIRPSNYLTNLLSQAQLIAGGQLVFPAGEARVAFVDPRDIADVAVAELLADCPTHGGLDLTGPEVLTHAEIAAQLAAALGHAVEYVSPPLAEWHEAIVQAGVPDWLADAYADLFAAIQAYPEGRSSPDLERVLGRPGRSVATWIEEVGAPAIRAAAQGDGSS